MYPEHWLFSQHPTLRDLDNGELGHEQVHLEQWEDLVWDVYCSVQEHIQCFKSHHVNSLPAYDAPASLKKRASDLRVRWVTESTISEMERNPLKALALRAACHHTEHEQVCFIHCSCQQNHNSMGSMSYAEMVHRMRFRCAASVRVLCILAGCGQHGLHDRERAGCFQTSAGQGAVQ